MFSFQPEYAQRMTLFVGFLGTVATILTALRSQYAWDQKSEAFRNAASEYHLMTLKLQGKLRKDMVSVEGWRKTWKEIDMRKEELQRKITVFPPTNLVSMWQAQGKFAQQGSSRGALMPPWALPHMDQLRKDGITVYLYRKNSNHPCFQHKYTLSFSPRCVYVTYIPLDCLTP